MTESHDRGALTPTPARALALALALLAVVLGAGGTSTASRTDQKPKRLFVTLGEKDAAILSGAQARREDGVVLRVLDRRGGVVLAAVPEDALDALARAVHRHFHRCGGFIVHPSRAAAQEALDQEVPSAPLAITYTIDNGPVAQGLIDEVSAPNIVGTITQLASYTTRYYTTATGVQAAQWLKGHWEVLAQGRSDVTVEFFNHPGWAQPSVILGITGATLPNEVVVIGGHLDSINNGANGVAPGADDDASGVATFTEVIRAALAKGYRPARTVKFMAYAAEEVGLRGSAEIATAYKNAGVNVVGVLQLDMTNYKGSTPDIVFMTDRTDAAQNAFLGDLVDTYLRDLTRSTSQCGYGCSDHASWNSRGYAASIPFEALMSQYNPYIHTAQDTLAQSGNNANHAVKFARLTAAYLAELAKGELGPTGGDVTPPTASITAPAGGATVSGTVAVTAAATDDIGVTKVELYADGGIVATDTAAPYSFNWDSLSLADGRHGLAAKAFDAAGNTAWSPTVRVFVRNSGPRMAAYDATRRTPVCALVGTACDSGMLLRGRDGKGPEPNQPNTLGGTCADGTGGGFHAAESVDRIRISTLDGTPLAAGKTVRIDATIWAHTSFSEDKLDLYSAANAAAPTWVFLTTVTPAAPGAQTLSWTTTLPSGNLQAVRARLRFRGSAASCGSGTFTDHDDLVFAVQ